VRVVTIPDAVTDLSYVFYDATSLSNVNIPAAATSIGEYSFYNLNSAKISPYKDIKTLN
jgi:hypothetical protein